MFFILSVGKAERVLLLSLSYGFMFMRVCLCYFCCWRDDDFVLGLVVCALAVLFFRMELTRLLYYVVRRCILAIPCRESQGPEPAGDRLSVRLFRFATMI